ncbi:Rieske (2Fe-2S) protein [Pseudofrankia asymbiotica]|uniref:Rieske domain-containing protein n=1 Tax=Pseudofrankia asymbiotica TaxID=1834516 RepID=A0A1V2IEQ3_9ACTN|nr:Rieske 2Fe-2S domain-containing protein [Pseudofrankia asymbiotica]ONH31634.1 hypothetical protein BL253_08135 [Pseudofrankia asymbiotica]
MNSQGLRRFVEDLLGHRRPRPFDATPEDAALLRAAITLRAARPGGDEPSEEFVEQLHRRLLETRRADAAASLGLAAGTDAAGPALAGTGSGERDVSGRVPAGGAAGARAGGRRRGTRRRFVQVTSIAAGSAAIGIGVDRAVVEGWPDGGDGADPPVAGADPSAGSGGVLVPDAGIWRTVATTQDLPEGGVRAFDAGTVVGFVRRVDGQVHGTSGVCTHQGCHLALDPAQRRLNCPCHRTTFALTGEVMHSQLRTPPRTLPGLAVREVDGVVQVHVPPTPT